MNQAKKNRLVGSTNPVTVLRGISAAGFDLCEASIGLPISNTEAESRVDELTALLANQDTSSIHTEIASPDISDGDGPDPQGEVPILRINPESRSLDDEVVHVIESQIESAKQVQQLASRLRENELELNRRADELEARIQQWNETQLEQELVIEKKLNSLSQQSSQVKCQQLHLMQLQTDIVKNQEAMRAAIEMIVESDSDITTMAAMKTLKQELSGRFDFIARRWQHLSNLMQHQRDQEALNKAS